MDNEEPLFIARNVSVAGEIRILRERHIKLTLATGRGDATIAALAWRWADRIAALGVIEDTRLDIVYRLRHNEHPSSEASSWRSKTCGHPETRVRRPWPPHPRNPGKRNSALLDNTAHYRVGLVYMVQPTVPA